jgi:hypothetical protein
VNRAPKVGRLRGRRWRWALVAMSATCVAGIAAGLGAVAPGRVAPPARATTEPRAAAVRVVLDPRARMTPIPRSYLGLSTEYWTLPLWATHMPLLERVLSLIHVAGDGPLVLRVGGDSADHSFWNPDALPLPSWAFTLSPAWLAEARQLVQAVRMRLILDLNLITSTPAAAAQWARAAQTGLPRGAISAFEIGNEPDIYGRTGWLAITASRRAATLKLLPRALTARDYVRDFRAEAEALEQAAPDVPLAGPSLANPAVHERWIPDLIAGAGPSLGLVTAHRYPYTACARRHPGALGTISRVLSPEASSGMANALRPAVTAAHDAGLALRLTELNSVTCGGRPGVSNTFATALWAPGALFALLRAGVDGVNLHVRANTINAPFAITGDGLTPRPLLYGLILFARALGRQPRLVPVRVRAPGSLNLQAWAVRVGRDRLHVLLIDKSRRPARVSLSLPAVGPADVQRLLAPGAAAETGVTLAGRSLGPEAQWQGPPAHEAVARGTRGYVVEVPRLSAALLSVRVIPGVLGSAGPRETLSRPVRAGSQGATRARRRRGAGTALRGA